MTIHGHLMGYKPLIDIYVSETKSTQSRVKMTLIDKDHTPGLVLSWVKTFWNHFWSYRKACRRQNRCGWQTVKDDDEQYPWVVIKISVTKTASNKSVIITVAFWGPWTSKLDRHRPPSANMRRQILILEVVSMKPFHGRTDSMIWLMFLSLLGTFTPIRFPDCWNRHA